MSSSKSYESHEADVGKDGRLCRPCWGSMFVRVKVASAPKSPTLGSLPTTKVGLEAL